ncbi:glycosyltransferase [Chiayiivirga flava]|uniref:glycosyltransferase n=1 Tax=Chiayiivirga flava TaxID=659595 RepID=UPI0016189F6B
MLYDFLQTRGGAERFTLDLRKLLPSAELWFQAASEHFAGCDLDAVHLLSRKPLSTTRALRISRCIHGFLRARRRFRDYDTLLLSGHYAPLAIDPGRPSGSQRRVYYAHTAPLPFAYDPPHGIIADEHPVTAAGVSVLGAWLKPRFEAALRGVDCVLANSSFTASEYTRRFGIATQVLHPPCDTAQYRWRPSDGHFLSFARQEGQKRVDRVVAAFRDLPHQRLVVASDGSDHDALVQLAQGAENIRFVRSIDPQVIRDLLERCTAAIHIPEREPFGMSVVESLAAGKPAVSVDEGGLPEILSSEGCGWLLPADPTPAQLAELVSGITEQACAQRRRACEARAAEFGRDRFAESLGRVLASPPRGRRSDTPEPGHASGAIQG